MANLTTDYLDKALAKQSKDLKGYVDQKNGALEKNIKGYVDKKTDALEHNLKSFVKKEIEELALMTARSFAAQGKEMQELRKDLSTLVGTVQKLSQTVEDLAAMTARQFAKHDNVVERLDKLERQFAEFRQSMQA